MDVLEMYDSDGELAKELKEMRIASDATCGEFDFAGIPERSESLSTLVDQEMDEKSLVEKELLGDISMDSEHAGDTTLDTIDFILSDAMRDHCTMAEPSNTLVFDLQDVRPKDRNYRYLYFIRISPVPLEGHEIKPSYHAPCNFQLRGWISPDGRLKATLTLDMKFVAVDPGRDGAFIIQALNNYLMAMDVGKMFLYVRVANNPQFQHLIEGHIEEMCGLFEEFRELFAVMDAGVAANNSGV